MSLSTLSRRFLDKCSAFHKSNGSTVKIYSLRRKSFFNVDPINEHEPTFSKILIANRGEIACRIIKTAKKMGIKTVAVYSVADARSRHVKLADESVFIGPSEAKESYLNASKIFDAIKSTGAEAVHPGYGFLSENSSFVDMLEKEGISFIGPSAKTINGMGDKLASKRLAVSSGVNTIPGYDGEVQDVDHCVEISRNLGYPVMIKASAGGGGKGMRIARNDQDAREGFGLSADEALSSFGDNRMLVEKFLEDPRHIEIQVLADKHGNAIYLNERECSIQRRNQKVIEEAPSVFLDNNTRKAMGEQAVKLCKELGYCSAGTVEFLVDKHSNFYFLEMNTRLQVEHAVTECITGIDLVQQMIRIAKGYELNIKQEDVQNTGWAVECRVYAEDPYKSFGMPNVGRLYKYIEPINLEGVRCDSGINEGSEISIYYDPMICKLVCYGENRYEAIHRSIQALDMYVIRGVNHNIPLLRDILTEKRFLEGVINTNYLNQVYADGFKGRQLNINDKEKLLAITSALYICNEIRNREFLNGPKLIIRDENIREKWELIIKFNEESYEVLVKQSNGFFIIEICGKTFEISKNLNLAAPVLKAEINGEETVVQLLSKCANGEYQIVYQGSNFKISILSKLASKLLNVIPEKPKEDVSKFVKAPMPGLVKTVSCKVGEYVDEGQELCIIEAMKMQNSMVATASGKIKTINIQEGDTVCNNDLLVEFE